MEPVTQDERERREERGASERPVPRLTLHFAEEAPGRAAERRNALDRLREATRRAGRLGRRRDLRGRPLLVLLGSEGGKSAWILLVGYDDEDEVFVAQRADGTLEGWPYDVLREKWSAGGRMTLLAVPETTKARTESKP